MKYFSLLFFGCLMFGCKSKPVADIVTDSVLVTVDSPLVILPEVDTKEADCYTQFFLQTNPFDTAKIAVIDAQGKLFTLKEFIQEQSLDTTFLSIAIKDADNNGVPELWLRNFSGGAHCCDEWYIFPQQANGKFRQTASLIAGDVCVADSIFTFSFGESLGYFKSCFACGYDDTTNGFKMIRHINLRYKQGRFEVIPFLSEAEKQLLKNLQILNEEGKRADMDKARDIKKEFAMNLAVYYYNQRRNIRLTKELFDVYYPFNDGRMVWKEFMEYLQNIAEFNGL